MMSEHSATGLRSWGRCSLQKPSAADPAMRDPAAELGALPTPSLTTARYQRSSILSVPLQSWHCVPLTA